MAVRTRVAVARCLLPVACCLLPSSACTPDEGVRAELLVRFEARETFEASDTLEVTVYDAAGAEDACTEVLAGSTAILGTLPIVAGPVSSPVRQASALSVDGVTFGTRLFFAAARLEDGRELARGCVVAQIGPSEATVVLTMVRVPCAGEGSLACGPDAVCRDGATCEDRACRIDAGPVPLSDLPYGLGVGASQVLVVGDGVLVAFTGAVGARGGVAIARLSRTLEPQGAATILDASPCTWPALAPVPDGALVVWGDCEGPDVATIRAAGLFTDGTPTGEEASVPLQLSLRSDRPAGEWNAPEFMRVVPTETGALAIWQELASEEATPDTGPWQIRTVLVHGEDASMPLPSSRAILAPALIAETAPTQAGGAAVQYVDLGTGDCHLAVLDDVGDLLGDDVLGGALSSCVTVAFGATDAGYSFLGQEIRRLVPWPGGEPTAQLLEPPDEPLEQSTYGAFATAGARIFLGWEEHSADMMRSRLQVAILDHDGLPQGPAVPLSIGEGGPYEGFAMAADGTDLIAAYLEGTSGSHRVQLVRIGCE